MSAGEISLSLPQTAASTEPCWTVSSVIYLSSVRLEESDEPPRGVVTRER